MKYISRNTITDSVNKYGINFFGYGNWDSDFWFIGLEEGTGDDSPKWVRKLCYHKVSKFIKKERTHSKLLDIFQFQFQFHPEYFSNVKQASINRHPPLPNYQTTHRRLIEILISLTGNGKPTANQVKLFQGESFGRIYNKPNVEPHGIIEFFPLPNHNRSDAIFHKTYSRFFGSTKYDSLTVNSKSGYKQMCFDQARFDRINTLLSKLQQYTPLCVLFYEPEMVEEIEAITGVSQDKWLQFCVYKKLVTRNYYLNYIPTKDTAFFVTEHPARTTDNLYWDNVCLKMIDLLSH